MTQTEFDTVQALTIVETMESSMMALSGVPSDDAPDIEQNQIRAMLRTWKARLRNSIEIRKKRADAGSPRT